MRTVPRKTLYKLGSSIVAAGLVLFAFQNCSQSGFDQALTTVSASSATPAETGAPFAFDAAFDQIAYNSCFGSTLSGDPGYFSLSSGAYAAGGVMVNQNFMNYANSNLTPAYPSTTVTMDQLKQFASSAPESTNANLQVALRPRGNVQQVVSMSSSTPAYGTDFFSIGDNLTGDAMMQTLFVQPGTNVNYFPLESQQSMRLFQAGFAYNADEGTAYALRNGSYGLQNGSQLTLSYTTTADVSSYAPRVPSTSTATNIAYGRGYNMTFAADIAPMTVLLTGNSAITPNYKNPNNILVSISEVSLLNPASSTGAVWNCDSNRRYVVVAAADAASVCPADAFSRLSDPTYRAELEIVRRQLRPESWDVSIDRRCVVPKQGTTDCYNTSDDDGRPVEYNQNNECYQGLDGMENQTLNKRCAQYVTFCVRQ